MLELGKRQVLTILRISGTGAYVGEEDRPNDAVLLPRRQVPEGAKTGDTVDVLLYRDSEDRIIATVHETKITVGELAFLKVVQVTDIGAFLDWGIERDLFMPFKEQKGTLRPGDTCLAGVYVDRTDRLCATMRIYDHLSADSPYQKGDTVKGMVYETGSLGAFVAVDDRYFGLIPSSEVYQDFHPGDRITAQVMKRRPDGKLDLRVRRKAYKQMKTDAKLLNERLEEAGGSLPVNDKSSPEQIRQEFGLSKAAFKRAVGQLLKEEKIIITDEGIRIRDKAEGHNDVN